MLGELLPLGLSDILRLPMVVGAQAASGGGGEAGKAVAREPSFQPYIFWAYGLACALLLIFTLWNIVELKRVSQRVDYLDDRLRRARPDSAA